ncbi:MAG: hypothetical protein HUK22_01175 [Thermoguttaceae bacterium]|nr:hypothetical protein [Thermoguttaceae bacterium]
MSANDRYDWQVRIDERRAIVGDLREIDASVWLARNDWLDAAEKALKSRNADINAWERAARNAIAARGGIVGDAGRDELPDYLARAAGRRRRRAAKIWREERAARLNNNNQAL